MTDSPAAPPPSRYAGDVTPDAAYAALADDDEAVLVDCRTTAEWHYVGTPDLSGLGHRPILLEWQRYPDGEVDPDFVDRLIAEGVPRHAPVYFLCRSGVRSKAAAIAATDAAFDAAYNILEGFEGDMGPDGKRTVAGWKVAGLPWSQS